MLELAYGFLVAVAAGFAWWSRSEVIRWTMVALYLAWYVRSAGETEDQVVLWLGLDLVLLVGLAVILWSFRHGRERHAAACIAGVALCTITAHASQALLGWDLEAHTLLSRLLYVVQLAIVVLYSIPSHREWKRWRERIYMGNGLRASRLGPTR